MNIRIYEMSILHNHHDGYQIHVDGALLNGHLPNGYELLRYSSMFDLHIRTHNPNYDSESIEPEQDFHETYTIGPLSNGTYRIRINNMNVYSKEFDVG